MPNVSNDIAIVQLSSDIDITASVRPVSFGSFNDDLHQIVGKNGTVIGFGLEENDRISGPLREATITVVDFMDCLLYDRDAYASVLTRNMFCAVGKNNTSACNGDSGGGMFFNVDGTWHLRGIVSFMPGRKHIPLLCDSSKPTVFTDVSKYREWVLRYKNTAKWLKELKPCQDGVVAEDAVCNAATRHGNVQIMTEQT
ncbi:hypothetical protein ZHAS_00006143 [Anopheles sinensis]|uniref:Peptidase S1 domain-containing protein n=1 Tax=Anopheles sinensis TaxID=74873 RepID=A0A084VLA0_ANOSI|nr:hypothetical protein ZHAS_00006143 [Anopheles sinensis]